MSVARWALAARARGPRHVALRAVSSDGAVWRRELRLEASTSGAEATAIGLAHGLRALRAAGANEVRILVTERTLDGYLIRGWRPKSVAMVSAMQQLVDGATGLRILFIRRGKQRRRGAPRGGGDPRRSDSSARGSE